MGRVWERGEPGDGADKALETCHGSLYGAWRARLAGLTLLCRGRDSIAASSQVRWVQGGGRVAWL